jgi:hypothetical protein
MVKFRCKRSGNSVSFSNEDDIRQMRSHESYEEIKDETDARSDEVQRQEASETQVLIPEVKRRGRPRKV